jgi:SPP1 gp7 family putative phage head morphogenesis protein
MRTLASFHRLPSEAVADLVGFTETGPLRELLDKLGPDVSQGFREALIESVAIGRNPRETARRVRKEFSVGLSKALRISRTEQLRSYRAATLRNYQANSDIIDGWVWLAAKQGRTCPMCLAMDGTEHKLSETLNDHPQGRCRAIPHVKGHKLPQRETGTEWFEKQDETTQRKVLGNAGYEAFKAGAVKLQDFVGQKRSKDWGTMRYAKSLTQILGREEAAKWKAEIKKTKTAEVKLEQVAGKIELDYGPQQSRVRETNLLT